MLPNEDGAEISDAGARRHAALVRLLRAIHVAATRMDDRPTAIGSVIRHVCEYLGWDLGHAYLHDASSGGLVPTSIWTEREPGAHRAFVEATMSTRFSPGRGLPGRALQSRHVEWVVDLSQEEAFLRRSSAAGIQTGVWVPVFRNGQVAGVLELFSERRCEPEDDLLTILEYVGRTWSRILGLAHLEQELGAYTERFEALVESASDAIVLSDDRGRIIDWNPAAESIFGYEASEVLGEPLTTIMPESFHDRHRKAFFRAVERESATAPRSVLAVEGLTKDGQRIPIELSLASWGSSRRYFAGIMRDVSEREAAEEELRLIGSATAHVRDAIVVSTAGNGGRGPTILYVNAAFSRMTGYGEAEALGQSFSLLAGPDTDRDLLQSVNHRLSKGEPVAVEITAYRHDGTSFLMDWQASPIYEADGSVRHVASIQRDITEERRVERALKRVDRDPLTGLANRKIFEERLSRCIARAKEREDARFAVIFLDLDGFKEVNDQHGHVIGDQLLSAVAGRLERTIRPGDTLARFGGDEFVVLLGHVNDVSDVIMVAERVQDRLSTPFDLAGLRVRVGASIGITLSESGYTDPGDVIRDADAAMYESKRKGKGRIEFHDRDVYSDIVMEFGLQEDLRRCLEREELELHYQPLVDLGTQDIIGFEALVRWHHPELGLLPPERFISLAEDSGLIVPMGRWILAEACRAAGGWQPDPFTGRPLTLSVNLSMKELSAPGVVDTVRSILEETGLDPGRLQLELTESVLVKGPRSMRVRIEAIRSLGVTVCIDDFGTGYSSLGYLRHFPVDKLKIDRLFVHHLDETPGNVEILRTILTLASQLGLEVVAEGVETEAELAVLREMACGYGQGFLFSKPIPARAVESLLLERSADTPATSSGRCDSGG